MANRGEQWRQVRDRNSGKQQKKKKKKPQEHKRNVDRGNIDRPEAKRSAPKRSEPTQRSGGGTTRHRTGGTSGGTGRIKDQNRRDDQTRSKLHGAGRTSSGAIGQSITGGQERRSGAIRTQNSVVNPVAPAVAAVAHAATRAGGFVATSALSAPDRAMKGALENAGTGHKGGTQAPTRSTDRATDSQRKRTEDFYKQKAKDKQRAQDLADDNYSIDIRTKDGKTKKTEYTNPIAKASQKAHDAVAKGVENAKEGWLDIGTRNWDTKKDKGIPDFVDKIPGAESLGLVSETKQKKDAEKKVEKDLNSTFNPAASEQKLALNQQLNALESERGWADDTELQLEDGTVIKWGEYKNRLRKQGFADIDAAVAKAKKNYLDDYRNSKEYKETGKMSSKDIGKMGIEFGSESLDYLIPYFGTAGKALKIADKAVKAGKGGAKAMTEVTEAAGGRALSAAGKDAAAKAVAEAVSKGTPTAEAAKAVLKKALKSDRLNSLKREALANAMQDAAIGTPLDLYKGVVSQGLEGDDLETYMKTNAVMNVLAGGVATGIAGKAGKPGKQAITKDVKETVNAEFAKVNEFTKTDALDLVRLKTKEKEIGLSESETARVKDLEDKAVNNRGGVVQMDSKGKIVANNNGVMNDILAPQDRLRYTELEAKKASGILTRKELNEYVGLSQKIDGAYTAVQQNATTAVKLGNSLRYARAVPLDDMESAVNFARKAGDTALEKKAKEARVNVAKKQFYTDRTTAKYIATAEERSDGNVIIRPMDEDYEAAIREAYPAFADPDTKIPDGMHVNIGDRTVIVIDPHGTRKTAVTLAHEIAHGIFKGDDGFFDTVKEFAGDEWARRYENAEQWYKGTDADLNEETACDVVGDFVGKDKTFFAYMAGENPSAFLKVRNYLRKVFGDPDYKKDSTLKAVNEQLEAGYKAMQKPSAGDEITDAMMGDVKFALTDEYAPTFYSKMYEVVDKRLGKGKRFGTQDFDRFFKKKGVRAEEVEWSGIIPWLNGRKSVTKEEMLDYIEANSLVLNVKKRGGDEGLDATAFDDFDFSGEWYTDDNLRRLRDAKDVKWDQYSLPGGENYREYEYTLPNGPKYSNDAMRAHWGDSDVVVHSRVQDFSTNGLDRDMEPITRQEQELYDADAAYEDIYREASGPIEDGEDVTLSAYPVSDDVNVDVYQLADPDSPLNEIGIDIVSTRTGEIIGMRMTSRENFSNALESLLRENAYTNDVSLIGKADAMGHGDSSVLFVEEIQSDWHNAASKKIGGKPVGYGNNYANQADRIRDEIDKLTAENSSAMERLNQLSRDRQVYIEKNLDATDLLARSREVSQEVNALREDLLDAEDAFDDAVNAVEKRVRSGEQATPEEKATLKEAANLVNGLNDRIGKLRDESRQLGEKYAEMYSDTSDSFPGNDEWSKLNDQTNRASRDIDDLRRKLFDVDKRANITPPNAPYKGKAYIEYAMKRAFREAAENGQDYVAWATAKQQSDRWSDKYAEGYRIEYDQDIPSFVNKYVKQFDPDANVERITLSENGEEVWAIKIPEKMKESVLHKGQPSFAMPKTDVVNAIKGGKVPKEANDAYMRAARIGDRETAQKFVDKILEERGYTITAYHGTDSFGFTKFDLDEMREIDPKNEDLIVFASSSKPIAGSYTHRDKTRMISARTDPRLVRGLPEYGELQKFAKDHGLDVDFAAYEKEFIRDPMNAETLEDRLEDAIIDSGYEETGSGLWSEDLQKSISEDDYRAMLDKAGALDGAIEENSGGIYRAKLKIDNPLVVNGGGEKWSRLTADMVEGDHPGLPSGELRTREVAAYARETGHDGVIFKEIRDIGDYGVRDDSADRASDVYVVFNSEQFKSADAITYDDNGEIIPLTERADEANPDIRYAMPRESRVDEGELADFKKRVAKDSSRLRKKRQKRLDKEAKKAKNKVGGGANETQQGRTENLRGTSEAVRENASGAEAGALRGGAEQQEAVRAEGVGRRVLTTEQAKELADNGVNVGRGVDRSNEPEVFLDRLRANAESQKFGVAVDTDMTPESLKGAKLYTVSMGNVTIGVKPNGDIFGLAKNAASNDPTAFEDAMYTALANGGNRCDAYGPILANKYAEFGFEPVAKVPFNPEYISEEAMPAFQAMIDSGATPHVYVFRHNGDSLGEIARKRAAGEYKTWTDEELDALPTYKEEDFPNGEYDNNYDAAIGDRNKALDAELAEKKAKADKEAADAKWAEENPESAAIKESNFTNDTLKAAIDDVRAAGIYTEEVEKLAKKFNAEGKKIAAAKKRIENVKKSKKYDTEEARQARIAELQENIVKAEERQKKIAGQIIQKGKMKAVDENKSGIEQVNDLRGGNVDPKKTTGTEAIKKDRGKIKDTIMSLRRLFFDSFAEMETTAKQTMKSNYGLGQRLLDTINNVRNARNIADNWINGERSSFGVDIGGKSLEDIWKPIKDDPQKRADFNDYLVMKHVPARHEKGTDIYADISPELAEKTVKELEDKYGDEITKFADDVYGYLNDLQQYRVDSGLLSAESAKQFKDDYPYYVPTNRANDPEIKFFSGSEGVGNNIRTAEGGAEIKESPVLDIYEQMYNATMKTITAAQENHMLNLYFKAKGVTESALKDAELDDLEHAMIKADIDKTGNGEISFFHEGKPVSFPADPQAVRGLREWDGYDYANLVKEAKKTTVLGKPFKAFITDWNLVFGTRNGMRDFQQALVNSKSTKYFCTSIPSAAHAIVTKNNAYRRLYAAMGGEHAQLVSFDTAGRAIGAEKDFADKFLENFDAFTNLKANPIKYIEHINGAIEMMPRMCEFIGTLRKDADMILKKQKSSYKELRQNVISECEQLVKDGKLKEEDLASEIEERLANKVVDLVGDATVARAMRNANDVTLNFGRHGVIGKALNMGAVPYFNPSLQGLSKLVRMFTERGAEGRAKALLNFGIKLGTFTIAPSVINEIWLKDNEDYQNLNTRDKDNNFFIPFGDEGKFLKLPKPRENAVLAEPAIYGLRWFLDKSEYAMFDGGKIKIEGKLFDKIPLTDEGMQMFRTALDNIGIINPIEGNIVSPLLLAANNKTWYGGNIESAYELENVKSKDRKDTMTSALAIQLGETKGAQFLNLSPKKIDYILDAYTGMIYDLGISQTSEQAKSELSIKSNPIVNQYIKDSVFSNKLATKAWAKVDGMSEDELSDYKATYMYDTYKYTDAIDYVTTSKDIPKKKKAEIRRDLKKHQNVLFREAVDGKQNSTEPLSVIAKHLGTDETLSHFLPKTGEEDGESWRDYYKAYKKASGYKDLSKGKKDKAADDFLNVYSLAVDGQKKIDPTMYHDSPKYGTTAVAAAQLATEGKISADRSKQIMTSCGVFESSTDDYQRYTDNGSNMDEYAATQKRNKKTIDKAKEYGIDTEHSNIWKNKFGSEKGVYSGALCVGLAMDKKRETKDTEYFISNPGDKNILTKMNAARGYVSAYDGSTKSLCKLAASADADQNTYLNTDEITDACANLKGGKATDEEKAIAFVLLGGNPNRNPFGEIGDYSLDADTGIEGNEDESGGKGGRRRRRRGRRGRRGGGGGGGGSSTAAATAAIETASGAFKGKVTAQSFGGSRGASDLTVKSNLDDAYRKRLAKLREQSRKNLA